MKKILLVALPLLFASAAQARPSTWLMTCAETANLVKNSNGIVMNHGYSNKAGYLYKMYYANPWMCQREGHYDAKRAYVRTSDVNPCWIGYECVPSDHDHGGRDGGRGNR